MWKSHFNDEFLVLLGPIISRLFTCSNAEKTFKKQRVLALVLSLWYGPVINVAYSCDVKCKLWFYFIMCPSLSRKPYPFPDLTTHVLSTFVFLLWSKLWFYFIIWPSLCRNTTYQKLQKKFLSKEEIEQRALLNVPSELKIQYEGILFKHQGPML
jgi:hypothetical protein